MDDIEQSNKKHLTAKSGRKFRENKKVKINEANKVEYKDSRGQSFKKVKKTVSKVNAKAFAIQNVAKAKKKVALVVDRQTKKHTYSHLSDQYVDAPQLICLVGPPNSGKSTLLRTLMRHYTGNRMTINGPVTVVTSKKKKVTFFECPNDLHSMIDVAKIADMILLMVNVKQGLQNEIFEFTEILSTQQAPRIKIVFTHLDEFPKHDVQLQKKIKAYTERIRIDVHALPFRLTEIKKFRKANNSEYKIEEVKNLARLIGQKNPRPNEWRQSHPYILVDRMEKVTKERVNLEDDGLDSIKFYGYVRGCTMLSGVKMMHLMGVGDFTINSVEPLNEPCPTPFQESKTPQKRKPLEIKERKAYAPMSGYGGVLKDFDGFHILSETGDKKETNPKSQRKNQSSDDEDSDDELPKALPSSLIRDWSDSDEDEDPMDCGHDELTNETWSGVNEGRHETKTLVKGFEELQSEMMTDNDRINYERLIYDEDYVCDLSALEKLRNAEKELSIDLFVTGKWDEKEDAATLLKKDDERLRKEKSKELTVNRKGKIDIDDGENDDSDMDYDEDDIEMDADLNEMDFDDDDEEDEEDETVDDDEDSDEEKDDDDEEIETDDDDEDSDEGGNDSESCEQKKTKESRNLFDGLVQDTGVLTEFQKKKLERASKTKREKKLEKKAKHKAMFDSLYDQKQGDSAKNNFFDQWVENRNLQEEKNKVAFENLETDDAYKFRGLNPGLYVCVLINKLPKEFFINFNPQKPVVLGALAPGEDANAMVTATFKLSRHFTTKQLFKSGDPLCLSIGWWRLQTFCYYFNEGDNLRKKYRKYSGKRFEQCKVVFCGPAIPVKTGFTAFLNFEHDEKFRLAAVGSVLSNDESVNVEKKLKRVGEPIKIHKKTAFIKGMFADELEVVAHERLLLKTTSGIRGCIKKAAKSKEFGPGTFRATFEAQIFMTDLVFLPGWVTVKMLKQCQIVSNLVLASGEVFEYWKLWNKFYKDKGIPLPSANNQNSEDSKYKKIERKPFNPAPIKFSKRVIDQLPFINRPMEETPADLFQKNRPKVVLDAQDSRRAQLVDSLMHTKEERRQKMVMEKQRYGTIKQKKMRQEEEKELAKRKKQSKIFFKNKSLKAGEAKRKSVKKDQ